jgi:hypothetical protein
MCGHSSNAHLKGNTMFKKLRNWVADKVEAVVDFATDKKAVVAGGITTLAVQAHATVPTEVTTAITDMKTDALLVATAFLVASIALTAFLFMRRGAK